MNLEGLNQHQLVEAVFRESGGQEVDALLPLGYRGKKADIVFSGANVIAEIKSLTTDRSQDDSVSQKLGAVLASGVQFGAPVAFGTVSINVNDLPRTVAERAVRVVGARARKEVMSAAKQIDETRSVLAIPDAYGLAVFICPAHVLGQQTLRWLIHDLLTQRGDFGGLDGAMLIQTPLCFGGGEAKLGPTFSSLWSISDRPFPDGFGTAIGDAWSSVTGQPSMSGEFEDFKGYGMVE